MMLTMIIRYTQDQKIGNKQSHDVDHDHNILILSVPDDHGQHHDFVCFQSFDHLSVPDDHGRHHDFVCFQYFDLECT
jgi:hypothetical protein